MLEQVLEECLYHLQVRLCHGTGCMLLQHGLTPGLSMDDRTCLENFETLSVLLALKLWGPRLSSVQLMAYVDNEGAKFSLIQGYSDSPSITFICALVALHLDHCCIMPWFSRVPSASNISDYPSRKTSHHLLKEAVSVPEGETHAVFEESLKQVESHIYKGGVRG